MAMLEIPFQLSATVEDVPPQGQVKLFVDDYNRLCLLVSNGDVLSFQNVFQFSDLAYNVYDS